MYFEDEQMGMIEAIILSIVIIFASFMFSIGSYMIGSLAIFGVAVYVTLALWMRRDKKNVEE